MDRSIIGTMRNGIKIELGEDALNGHIIATGKSGSGKTTALLATMLQEVARGRNAVVINWKNSMNHELIHPELRQSYEKYTTVLDIMRDGLQLPIFDLENDCYSRTESPQALAHRVTSMLKNSCGLTPSQEAETDKAVASVLEEGSYRTEGIRAVSRCLKEQRNSMALRAASKLRKLCDCNFIRDGRFWDLESKIYEIDLNPLEEEDQMAIILFLLDYIYRRTHKGDMMENGFIVLIDECQNLSFSKGSPMFYMLNEARKMKLSLYLASPSIGYFGRGGLNVILQCGCQLFFSPGENDRGKIAEIIGFGKKQKWERQLLQLRRGEFIGRGNFSLNDRRIAVPLHLRTYLPE